MAPRPQWTNRLVDMLVDPVCAVDRDGRVVFTNTAYQSLLGYSADELRGRQMMELIHPDDRAATEAAARAIMAGVPVQHFRNRYLRRDGGVAHLMWAARWSEADGVRVGVARDMTLFAREEAMKSLAADLAQAALDPSPLEGGWQAARTALGRHLAIPAAVAFVRGPSRNRLLGGDAVPADVLDAVSTSTAAPPNGFVDSHGGLWWLLRMPCGDHDATLALACPAVPPIEMDDEVLHFVAHQLGALVRVKWLEEELAAAALHDALTGLPNRRLLADRGDRALAHAQREGARPVLLFLDLDDFKVVNDRFSHAAGDAVLVHTARALGRHLREADTVARLGGDEFVILLDGSPSDQDVAAIVESITAALAEPLDLPLSLPPTRASIGVARYPQDGRTLGELLDVADGRMYDVKSRHGEAPASAAQA